MVKKRRIFWVSALNYKDLPLLMLLVVCVLTYPFITVDNDELGQNSLSSIFRCSALWAKADFQQI
jgi:hypothetical protein